MRHIRVLSKVPVMKNWYKNYTEMYIYILKFCLRFIKLNRSYSTNAQAIWKQRYKWIYKLIFIDIIDNIIYASRTCHQNSNQWQSSIIVMCLRLYHMTSILHCHWREFWSRNTDVYLTYLRFGLILTQFYINFSRREDQIDVL